MTHSLNLLLVEMFQSLDALIFVRCWITRSIRQSQCNTLLNCKGKTFWKYRLIRTGIKHVTAGWQCDGVGGDCRTLQPGRFRWTPFCHQENKIARNWEKREMAPLLIWPPASSRTATGRWCGSIAAPLRVRRPLSRRRGSLWRRLRSWTWSSWSF